MIRALAVLSVLVPAVAAAQPSAQQVDTDVAPARASYSLDYGAHVRWLGDTSGAIASGENTLGGPRLTLGRSLTTVAAARRTLAVGVFTRWVYAAANGTMFQDLDTRLSQHALTAGVRIDAPLVWHTRLVAEAEAGMARTALQITQGDLMPVDDHAWGTYASASVGLDFALYEGPRVRVALGSELGYVVTAPASLRALPDDRPDTDLSVPTTFASIGRLDTRGVTYQGWFRVSF
ncbi:MAG TPA: hypothetical protein VFQ53_43000 [Kofleriaceae bacterium]|nr:hypothetical protein [Kofleriaceae bacterium]